MSKLRTGSFQPTPYLRVFLHYKGKIIFKAQGLGTREAAVETDIPPYPALIWVGRLEFNKNWQKFLYIGHRVIQEKPKAKAKLWFFHDPTLAFTTDEQQFYETLKNTPIGR